MNKAYTLGLAALTLLQHTFSHADDLKPKVVAATAAVGVGAAAVSFAHFRSARSIRANSPTVIFDRLGDPTTPREIGMAVYPGDEVRVTYEIELKPTSQIDMDAWIQDVQRQLDTQKKFIEFDREAAHQPLHGKKGVIEGVSQTMWEPVIKEHIIKRASKGAVREFVEGVLAQGGKLVKVTVVPESALKAIDKTKAVAVVAAVVAGANAVGSVIAYHLGPSNPRLHGERSSDRLADSGTSEAPIAARPLTQRDLAGDAR